MKTLYIVRGIPGSGKSTFAKSLGGTHFEADMFFMKDGEYKYDMFKIKEAHKWCQEQTDRVLAEGEMVVVSNTFTTKKELKPYFELAKKYNIIPTVILCQNNFGSIHNVPEETIEKMKQRFQYDISELFEVL